jgi:TolB protein
VRRDIDSSSSLRSISSTQRRRDAKTQRNFLLLPFAFCLLVLIGAGFWLAFLRNRQIIDAPDWAKATNTQLTDQSATEFFPSLAPDGKSFVYASEADGDFDVYWQRIGGKNPNNLTKNSSATDTQPAFSPDGNLIAFRSEREQKGIYVTEATGENTRRICDFGYHPSWSPDGKEIVVSTEERDLPNVRNTTPSSLWIVNVETGAKRMLIEMDAMQPSWSPSGKRIAFWFMHPGGSKRDVATVAVGGGEPVIVSKDGTTNWNPIWSPDGNFIYFVSDKGGNMGFWRVPVNEATGEVLSAPEAVVTPSKYSRHPSFSRDGKRLIYVQSDFKSNIQAVGFDAKNEKTIGDPHWITSGDRQVSRVDLSPDGKQFVSRLPRRRQDDIALINRETGEIRDLTNDAAFDRYPRWSPDGKKIAFISDRGGSHEIWTIDADGSNLKQITFNNSEGVAFPHWSPDGNRMLFRFNQQNFLFDLNKNWNEQKPSALPAPPNDVKFVVWDWSPDGKLLIGTFSDGMRGIGYYSFVTNHYEKISDIEEIPMCLPDSRRIAYASQGKIYITDIETKKERQISLPQPDSITTVGVSRDNSLLYFTVTSKESDIWLLDASQNQ